MAWTYLAESAASAKPWNPGCGQPPTVNKISSANPFCFHEWAEGNLILPPSGMMCEPLKETCFPEWISSLGDSPARIFLWLEGVLESMEAEAAYSAKSSDLLASFDPPSCSWKTYQLLLFGGGGELLRNLPKQGMTHGGLLYRQQKRALTMAAIGGGVLPEGSLGWAWPTPTRSDDHTGNLKSSQQKPGSMHSVTLPQIAEKMWRTPDTGSGGTSGRLARGEKARPSGAAITMRLEDQVRGLAWPTPAAQDGKNDAGPSQFNRNSDPLNVAAAKWQTPQAGDYRGASPGIFRAVARHKAKGVNKQVGLRDQCVHQAPVIQKAGPSSLKQTPHLNPRFVEALLGYKPGVTELEPWVIAWMLSARKKRSKS